MCVCVGVCVGTYMYVNSTFGVSLTGWLELQRRQVRLSPPHVHMPCMYRHTGRHASCACLCSQAEESRDFVWEVSPSPRPAAHAHTCTHAHALYTRVGGMCGFRCILIMATTSPSNAQRWSPSPRHARAHTHKLTHKYTHTRIHTCRAYRLPERPT